MLDKLKLLHAFIGGLVSEAEAGALRIDQFFDNSDSGSLSVDMTFTRVRGPVGCDHQYRRIASGEYECRVPGCGALTDEPEGEQWS